MPLTTKENRIYPLGPLLYFNFNNDIHELINDQSTSYGRPKSDLFYFAASINAESFSSSKFILAENQWHHIHVQVASCKQQTRPIFYSAIITILFYLVSFYQPIYHVKHTNSLMFKVFIFIKNILPKNLQKLYT